MGIEAQTRDTAQPDTREHLIKVAERLYAEHGLDAVSMRQISREAGQRNTSSVHYYFGTRDAIIEAVVEWRMSAINQRRLEMLAELKAQKKETDLREIVALYVRPLAAQVTGTGGNAYVRFLAQAYASTEIDISRLARGRWDQSLNEVTSLARAQLPDLPMTVFRERMAFLLRGVVYALADLERDAISGRKSGTRLSFDDLVEDLIDTQTAAIAAPCRVALP
jgi:AcrR family transcriptional regulator